MLRKLLLHKNEKNVHTERFVIKSYC